MATDKLDIRGMLSPQPIIEITSKIPFMKKGDILEVHSDCPRFEHEIKLWCKRVNRQLLSIRKENDTVVCRIMF